MQMYEQGLITEVHLWDFTGRDRNLTERALNKEWIESKAAQHKFVKVFHKTPGYKGPSEFTEFYQYYAKNTSDQDVIVKLDDDIVFVNVSEVKCFVKFVAETTEAFTVSANVVNNGVIAHFQQALGSIPLDLGRMEYPSEGLFGILWGSSRKAYDLHKYFVTHQEDFFKDVVVRYWARLSVNCITYSGRKAEEVYRTVLKHSDDEQQLTTAVNKAGAVSLVYMRLVVAHLTFVGQSKPPERTERIKSLYENLESPQV